MVKTNSNTYFEVDNRYRKSSTSYVIGDIVYSKNLSNSYQLECVVSGISDSTEPVYTGQAAGLYIVDGTVTWIIDDIHDNNRIGNIILGNILYPGYIQANGALLNDVSINYPRLINFLNNNSNLLAVDDTTWNSNKALYVYDYINDTLRVPDATNRMLSGGNVIESVEAGLPNITGTIGLDITSYKNVTGSFYEKMTDILNSGATINTNSRHMMFFDASRSNPIYGKSNTVQPPAIKLIPQIKY